MSSQSKKLRGSASWRRAARVAALLLAAWILLSWVAARALIVSSEQAHADALVVLAGSATYRERARWAARLFLEGRAPKIILTDDGLRGGWSITEQRNLFFVERAAQELQRGGVPANRIEVIPQVVSGTHEEALRVREYASTHDLHSILVVTSAYQSRRALWTLRRVFKDSGMEVRLEAAPTGEQTPSPTTWWWHKLGWQLVGGEYVKMVYYLAHY
jgi:uncharacterized SAM-binding protein YcdF (DUF218 family)